jgi:hypothetical protein
MKKLLWVIIGLGLFVILVQAWEAQYCKKVVKDMTGAEAIEKYEECKKW